MAAVLQFPFARAQMRAMREQSRGQDLDGDVSEDTQVADDLAARREKFAEQAPALMNILEPVFWQWKGASLKLSFAVKVETIKALAADKQKALMLFSAIHAVVTCDYWWTILSADDIRFDPSACLIVVSFTVAEYICKAPEHDDEDGIEEEYHECLRPGVNNANFDWRYVFKKKLG